MKKLFTIGGIIIILGVALWFFWPRSAGVPLVGDNNATTSPFGTGDTVGVPGLGANFEGELPTLNPSGTEGNTAQEEVRMRLFKVSAVPVAGFVALARGSSTLLRFVERATGHISDAKLPPAETGGDLTKSRLTNETIPQIYEAYFRSDGLSVLLRSLDSSDTVKNMSVALVAPKASSTDSFFTLSMTLLRGTIDSLSSSGNSLYYEAKDTGSLLSSGFAGEGVKTWWRSGNALWRTGRLGANMLIFTKPSASLSGDAYSLSPQGALTKLVGPAPALDALGNASGSYLIYSYLDGNATRLFVTPIGKSASEINPATLADKCVWSVKSKTLFYCGAPSQGVSGAEPDGWYQGKTHFSDDLWRFDANTGAATLLTEPLSEFGANLDVMNPALSPDESYLIFINKTDLSLWALSLR